MKDDIAQRHPVLALGTAPPRHADQAGQLTVRGAVRHQRHQAQPFFQQQLAADDQLDARRLRRHMGLHYAGKRALVGDRQRAIAQRGGALHQFMRVGGAAQEAVAAEAVEFGVGHGEAMGNPDNILYIYTVVQNPRIAREPRAGVRGKATGGSVVGASDRFAEYALDWKVHREVPT